MLKYVKCKNIFKTRTVAGTATVSEIDSNYSFSCILDKPNIYAKCYKILTLITIIVLQYAYRISSTEK